MEKGINISRISNSRLFLIHRINMIRDKNKENQIGPFGYKTIKEWREDIEEELEDRGFSLESIKV